MKEEIIVDESDILKIMNKGVTVEETEMTQDVSTTIKEEYIIDYESEYIGAELQPHSTETEEIFLNEPDCDQFIDECFPSDAVKKISVENSCFDKRSSRVKDDSTQHFTIKMYMCDICNRVFTLPCSLRRHKLIHSGIKRHKCDVCGKAFTQAGALSRHKLLHSGLRNFRCDICNKAFRQACHLSQHQMIHSGIEKVKKYKCDVCNRLFGSSSNLSAHKFTHSDVKKFQCNICNKYFRQPSSLWKHKLLHKC